jgi:phosphoglycerate dehydrogenase-like enzyme
VRVLVIAPESFAGLDLLARETHGVDIAIGTDAPVLRKKAAEADAVVVGPRNAAQLTALWNDLKRVRWIHSLAAGVESLPFDLLRRTDVVVTNSRGLYADALGEFAIAAMLWFAKDLARLRTNQAAHRWEPFTVERIEGKTAGVIGYGGIGQAIGRRASSLGMNVLSVRRRQEFGDPSIDDVIAESDYVVLSAPLTPLTVALITRERLRKMRPNAVLINVSRGAIVDEKALVEMLQAGAIRGAALDVFETEPLPAHSPLWDLDNVLLSPHSADHTADAHQRAMQFYVENLRRFQRGDPLENVVDKDQMY